MIKYFFIVAKMQHKFQQAAPFLSCAFAFTSVWMLFMAILAKGNNGSEYEDKRDKEKEEQQQNIDNNNDDN